MAVKADLREISVENELTRRVHLSGGVCWKVRMTGQRGFFDRIVIMPGGRIVFVECKRPRGGRIAPHQVWCADVLKGLGAEVALVKNSEDIDRLLTVP